MRETLEALYYGNITPYDRQIRSGTSLMKAMEQSHKCEEHLTKLLEGDAHSLLPQGKRRSHLPLPLRWDTEGAAGKTASVHGRI